MRDDSSIILVELKGIMIRIPIMLAVVTACAGPASSVAPSYDLAHNTERTAIMEETSQVLMLYNFVIESNDTRRDWGALQTFWRTSEASEVTGNDTVGFTLRDRAFLHISPRGKSSITYNVYQMVNASLEFEVQLKKGNSWVDIAPYADYEDQYKKIVRDIRNRMLRYRIEF